MELALDTSTETASIAIASKGLVQAELTWRAGQNHSVELLPSLEYVLKLARVAAKDLDVVIIARGPGSFNGLRVGLSSAKALCVAWDLPLVGIGTLEVEAYAHAEKGLPVYAISDAGRGEIAVALFETTQGTFKQTEQERITTIDQLCADIHRKALFCGRMNDAIEAGIRKALGDNGVIVTGASSLRRAGYLAELGWHRLEAGRIDDVASLQPLYLRRPHITEPRPNFPGKS